MFLLRFFYRNVTIFLKIMVIMKFIMVRPVGLGIVVHEVHDSVFF